jgi:hypothetical protein
MKERLIVLSGMHQVKEGSVNACLLRKSRTKN